jgi:hypothetical protein
MLLFFSWLTRRRGEKAAIAGDADAMIEQFGDAANIEAGNWVIAEQAYKDIDTDRPAGH